MQKGTTPPEVSIAFRRVSRLIPKAVAKAEEALAAVSIAFRRVSRLIRAIKHLNECRKARLNCLSACESIDTRGRLGGQGRCPQGVSIAFRRVSRLILGAVSFDHMPEAAVKSQLPFGV